MAIATRARKSALIALLISALATPIAEADVNNQPTPSVETFKAQMEQFRIDRENYMNAMRARGQQIRAINQNFKNACDTATTDFKSAMASAKGPDAKNSAIAARKLAISSAIAARDTAIAALGAEPIAPIEPTKPLNAPKNKNR